MACKFVSKLPKEVAVVSNDKFIAYLEEQHLKVCNKRRGPVESIDVSLMSIAGDDNTLLHQEKESKEIFDFFQDDEKDVARLDVIFDLEKRIIEKPDISKDQNIVDRRKSKRK